MLKLTRHDSTSAIPLELDGITPTQLAPLSLLEIGKLPVFEGNRNQELGQFFEIVGNASDGKLLLDGDTRTVKQVGAGMTGGYLFACNGVGMHAGARMTGGTLVLDSGAGDWLGAEMKGGEIEVRGNAGGQVGAAYRGSRRGMTGGTIHIRGTAGDELGLLMRRGLIIVEGDCGEFAAASMIAGTIALLGGCGPRLGAGMKRGTVLAWRATDLPASFRFACEYRPSFLPLYLAKLRQRDVIVGEHEGTVRCYRGDILNGGRGEVLVGL